MTPTEAPMSDSLTPRPIDYAEYVRLDVTKYISSFLHFVEEEDKYLYAKRRIYRAIQIYQFYIGLHFGIELPHEKNGASSSNNLIIKVPKHASDRRGCLRRSIYSNTSKRKR
jgi:hypothetical protein